MAERLCKCYGSCGQKYPKSELYELKNKRYCKSCYNTQMKEIEEREQLIKYICRVFGINFPSPLILKHVKEYHENLNFSYKKIRLCLQYCYEIKKMNFELRYGIRLLEYYFDESWQYYVQLYKAQQECQIKKTEEVVVQAIINNKRKPRLMDITKY